jgi:hypothetical protein
MATENASSGHERDHDRHWSVSGLVLRADGLPLAHGQVRLIRKQLRHETPLGESTTGHDGTYRIHYQPPKGVASVDVLVRVFQDDAQLAESALIFGASAAETVNLSIGGAYQGPSELTALLGVLQPALDGVAIGDLQQNADHHDLGFLSGALGQNAGKLASVALAYRLAKLAPDLAPEVFYAFIRTGVSSQLATVLQSLDTLNLDDNFVKQALQALLSQTLDALETELKSALALNLVPATLGDQLGSIMAKVSALRLQYLGTQPYVRGKTPLSSVLAAGNIAADVQGKFITAFAASPEDVEAAIAVLRKDTSITKQNISDLRFTLGASELLAGNLPLLGYAVTQRSNKAIQGAGDLARLDPAGWTALLDKLDPGATSIPPFYPDETPAQKIQRFSFVLAYRFEKRFPTTALIGRLAADTAPPLVTSKLLLQFLGNNPQLELRDMNLDRYLYDHPDALAGVPDAAAMIADAKRTQRLLKLFPGYDVMKPLLADGLDSAQAIYAMGETRFVAKYGPSIGNAPAVDIFRNAARVYSRSLALYAKYNGDFNRGQPRMLGKPPQVPQLPPKTGDSQPVTLPDLAALFGSLDYCRCDDCRSVLSPAAYFVDLLHFLGMRQPAPQQPRDVLYGRRPDLWDVMLSCDNSNIALPLIDLVCETLEDAVSPSSTSPPIARQSSGSPDDLRATPAFVNGDAYEVLRGVAAPQPPDRLPLVFPLTMPFDLWIEQSRAYLHALGYARADLMALFQDASGAPASELISAEALGFGPAEYFLVVGATQGVQSWDLWGLAETGNSVPDPANPSQQKTGIWTDLLTYVPIFEQRAQISYDQLRQLLDVRYVNPAPGGNPEVQLQDGTDPLGFLSCQTQLMSLAGLATAAGFTDRAHYFLRLWRKTGLSMWDLDRVLASPALGDNAISPGLFLALAPAVKLQARLALPWDELLALWGAIDTADVIDRLDGNDAVLPGPYTRIFLSPTLPGAAATFTLPLSASITPAATVVAAALKLTAEELTAVRADAHLDDSNGPAPLTVVALSTMLAYARLAAALNIPVRDLILWKSIANGPLAIGPGATPAGTTELLRRYDLLQTTALPAVDVDYVLRGGSADRSSLVVSDDTIARQLADLRVGLQKVADKVSAAAPTQADRARALLALVPLAPADVTSVAQIVEGTYSGNSDAFLVAHCPFLSAADRATLEQPSDQYEQRYALVANAAQPYVTVLLDHSYVKQEISAQTGIAIDTAEVVLTNVSVGQRLLVDVLDDAALLQRDANGDYLPLIAAQFPDAFAAYRLLAKIDAILGVLKLPATDVAWLLAHSGNGKWLDTTNAATDPYTPFDALLRATQLQRLLRGGTLSFFQYVDAVQAPATLAAATLAAAGLLGWDPQKQMAEVQALVQNLGIAVDSDAYKLSQLAVVERLVRMSAAVKGLGAPAQLALSFAKALPDSTDAAAVRQTLKAKYDASAWNAAVTPIEDALRLRRRDALVSYLLAHPRGELWQTSDDLYARFLIDNQIDPCQLTTRIKQATASLQLFIQRCFLQLEQPAVSIDAASDPDWQEWSWRQRFRVWQAAREIFLWPENYLLPDLRVNRSPFFDTMVKQLTQGDGTVDADEDAFRDYLRSLSDVARLSVCAHYHQSEPGRDVLHVFARSRGTPPTYYYRQLTQGDAWTAWEKLDAGITGDHLVVVEWNRRLHLLWPVFTAKAKKVQGFDLVIPSTQSTPDIPGPGSSPSMPDKIWEIQIAWSELRDGVWTPQRVTSQKLIDPEYTDPSRLCFKAFPVGDGLEVDVFRYATPPPKSDFSVNAPIPEMQITPLVFRQFAQFILSDVYDDVVIYSSDNLWAGDFNVEDQVAAAAILPLNQPKPDLVIPGGSLMKPWYQRFATNARPSNYAVLAASAGNPISAAPLLTKTYNASLAIAQQDLQFDSLTPFFIEDQTRSFFVRPEYFSPGSHPAPLANTPRPSSTPWVTRYLLTPFYHPFNRTLIAQLNAGGVDALLSRALQVTPDAVRGTPPFNFHDTYWPTNFIDSNSYPAEDIDFKSAGAYSLYNWELFFHAPLHVALRLSANQQFDDARRWFQHIFDPTDAFRLASDPTAVSHFWRTKPFYLMTDYQNEEINALLELVSLKAEDSATDLQLDDMRRDPGDAHAIASLRQVAYQKTTVMKYIDNLIAWGDQLFAQDTMETLAEATQLYVMAADLLGPRPQQTRPAQPPAALSFGQLLQPPYLIDGFSNAVVDVENLLPAAQISTQPPQETGGGVKLPTLHTQYFCVPPNPVLLGYWDTVADRLYKIRHCENLAGQAQQLPLYEPPINPMLLVQAAAAGVDLSTVLADENAPLPFYRYVTLAAKAIDLCNEVRSLGGLLLSALEKKDAEALAALRATQEVALLDLIRDVKVAAVHEAEKNRAVLDKTLRVTQGRHDHYQQLKSDGWTGGETASVAMSGTVTGIYTAEAILYGLAAAFSLFPDFLLGAAGFGGTPTASASTGGVAAQRAGHMAALAVDKGAAALSQGAQLSQIVAGFDRREQDWDLQIDQAQRELDQIAAQQTAADKRVDVANAELAAHDLQAANAQSVVDYLTTKFTNADLYDYLSSQVSTVYFQAYQLAYELAKKANRCFNFELGSDETFIQFGYWDSLHKGLLAGERLAFDLRRMDAAYHDLDKRELEMTKHFSLALNRPEALVQLRTIGVTNFSLLEADFDDDYPGHYFRRLKSASLTIPCVVGPYQGVNATLTLTAATVRVKPDQQPSSLRTSVSGVQAIATSGAQNDAGLFEVNFHDPRYLPFEGQGAVSSWQLELLPDTNSFDVSTISDVVLHLKYTARADASLKAVVLPQVQAAPRAGALFLSAKAQFPDDFYRFFNPTGQDQTFWFDLDEQLFPYIARGKTITVSKLEVLLVFKNRATYTAYAGSQALTVHTGPGTPPTPPAPTASDQLLLSTGGLPYSSLTVSGGPGSWYLTALERDIAPTALNTTVNDPGGTPHSRIDPALVDDVVLVVSWSAR